MTLGAGVMAWLRHTLVAGTVVTMMTIGGGEQLSRAETTRAWIRVVVWDEQQPEQKPTYANFLGNEITGYLQSRPGLKVRSVNLDDEQQGLSAAVLDACDVLVFWDHARHQDVSRAQGKDIVKRVKSGEMALLALHSAHWSIPFIEMMNEVTRMRARSVLGGSDKRVQIEFLAPSPFVGPKRNDPVTPLLAIRKFPDRLTKISVTLPNCAFPAWAEDGRPSYVTTLKPQHPIAKGVPKHFKISATEMYDEPFHIPEPDAVIFEERWSMGEWFRSGCVWQVGKGKVFYFRPGHETFPVYKEEMPLRIVENAVRWLSGTPDVR